MRTPYFVEVLELYRQSDTSSERYIVRAIHCSDEGLTSKRQLFYPLRWLIYVFNPVVNAKLPAKRYVCSLSIGRHRKNSRLKLLTLRKRGNL